jgi:outer membrane receptor protein involved in Fe transport
MASYDVYDVWLSCNTALTAIDFTTNFSIDNLFNEEYMVLERAPIPGRVYRLKVSLKFKLKEKQE